MDIQRLRNLTTGRLHTDIGFIYEDLGIITGETGLMTHMLPRAMKAVTPWLRKNVTDPRFWDATHDPEHTGDFDLPTPTGDERREFAERFAGFENPLDGKAVIGAKV